MVALKENTNLLRFNTFKVSANSRYFAELHEIADIGEFIRLIQQCQPVFIIGGGSNVLFTKDFEGLVARILIRGIEVVDQDTNTIIVRAGAGEDWDAFVDYCVNQKWAGIENLSYIPGLVGASPVQNIGAYGVEIMNFIDSVEGFMIESGKHFQLKTHECNFSYRNSIFKHELKNRILITHVNFRLHKEPVFNTSYPDLQKELENYDETNLQNIRQAIISIRRRKLPEPAVTGNAGSFFKNPVVAYEKAQMIKSSHPDMPFYKQPEGTVKIPAAWLIDKSGWKGKHTGNVGTHKNQPLIIINRGNATGAEIYEFALKVQEVVINHFGIRLETEVNIL